MALARLQLVTVADNDTSHTGDDVRCRRPPSGSIYRPEAIESICMFVCAFVCLSACSSVRLFTSRILSYRSVAELGVGSAQRRPLLGLRPKTGNLCVRRTEFIVVLCATCTIVCSTIVCVLCVHRTRRQRTQYMCTNSNVPKFQLHDRLDLCLCCGRNRNGGGGGTIIITATINVGAGALFTRAPRQRPHEPPHLCPSPPTPPCLTGNRTPRSGGQKWNDRTISGTRRPIARALMPPRRS